MIYTDREKLTVIKLSEEKDILTFDELAAVLWERPSNMIYVELAGLLYGIVSMGRICRANGAGKSYVEINKRFTWIYSGEYMRARQIFKDKATINALPVIDKSGKLLGDYTRWDDLVRLEQPLNFLDNENADDALMKICRHAVLIRPCDIFENKQRLFFQWKDILEASVETVEIIERQQVLEYSSKDDVIILFTDEDEQRGIITLCQSILKRPIKASLTFKQLSAKIPYMVAEMLFLKPFANTSIKSLQKQGVHFLLVSVEENKRGYLKKFNCLLDQKFGELGEERGNELLPQAKKEFFGEIYNEEYAKQFFPIPYRASVQKGAYRVADNDLPLFHTQAGERRTVNQPASYERCIYMYGPCIILGSYVEDKHTIASWLQNRLNCAGFACKVVNFGVHSQGFLADWNSIAITPLKKGDIVIWCSRGNNVNGITNINLTDVLEENNVPAGWVVNSPQHCNYKVNKLYADAIYNALLHVLQEPVIERKLIEMAEIDFRSSAFINRNFSNFDPSAYGTIGSIVMNCNPFTLGHRYLIENALKIVDYLIIFVVEEDLSLFTFEERFTMVCNGVADLKNVSVVPSGDVILSQTTFPEYFVKVVDEDIIQNVENDITIFAERIAPKLNITYRFVGEEPEDIVTNEYNNAMKRILPSHEISLVEIPRLEKGGRVISASSVRNCLEEGENEQLDLLIPESTKQILFLKND